MIKRCLTDTTAIGLVRHDLEPHFSFASSPSAGTVSSRPRRPIPIIPMWKFTICELTQRRKRKPPATQAADTSAPPTRPTAMPTMAPTGRRLRVPLPACTVGFT